MSFSTEILVIGGGATGLGVARDAALRGYQTLLVLYAFVKWAAKLAALRNGRGAATLGDVQEAVRLVEQRFVQHARFADVFSLSPVLTAMADRLYRQPAFVRGAALEPGRS